MVELTNLVFGYRNQPLLFDGLDLKLEAGHIYGLLGKNGSGKTTLLKNMVGLAYPKSGTAIVHGIDVTKRFPTLLHQLFFLPEESYVPDNTANAFIKMTAGFYPDFDQTLLQHYLDDFEVPMQRVLTKLSLGQQKKFMIAFALACRTPLLVMDEPTNGLDIPSKTQFRKIIAAACDADRCVVLATHQVRDLDNLIDTVIVLHDKQIKLHIPLDELIDRVRFGTAPAFSDAPLLYGEETFGGVHGIMPNPDRVQSKPDLELLFNAVVGHPEALLSHLTNNGKHE